MCKYIIIIYKTSTKWEIEKYKKKYNNNMCIVNNCTGKQSEFFIYLIPHIPPSPNPKNKTNTFPTPTICLSVVQRGWSRSMTAACTLVPPVS